MSIKSGFNSIRVIQSLGEIQGQPGVRLCERLSQSGALPPDLDTAVFEVFDKADLRQVLTHIFHSDIKKGKTPILHFEVHGNNEGFQLRDGSFVTWEEFGPALAVLNVATKYHLLVIFACCDGYMQIDAIGHDHPAPFAGLLGCAGLVSTPELLDGLEAFYSILISEGNGSKALEALQNAVTISSAKFDLLTCEGIFAQICLEMYLENFSPAYLAEKKLLIKGKAEKLRKESGQNLPLNEKELDNAFGRELEEGLRAFHSAFFALDLVPENKERFNFESITAAARLEASKLRGGT